MVEASKWVSFKVLTNGRMNNFGQYAKRLLRITKGVDVLPRSPKKILIIQLGDIGDLVLSVPTIRSIRDNYPDSIIYVAAREKASELVKLCPWADGVIPIIKKKRTLLNAIKYQLHFFRDLRAMRFDMVFDMRTGTRGGFLAILSGARVRLGFTALADKWRNIFFTHLLFPPMDMPYLHMSHYHLLLLNSYGLKVNTSWPELSISDRLEQQISELLEREQVQDDLPIIAIQPLSLWRYKEWGTDKFGQLARWIHDEYGFSVVICGTEEEHHRIQQMISKLRCEHLYNFAGKTTIDQYAGLLKRCSLFIGCDSAGVHIAAAVGTATATIFGPSNALAWAPRGPDHVVIRKEMDCIPCQMKGCGNTGRCDCLEMLTVEEVAQGLLSSLDMIEPNVRNSRLLNNNSRIS